MFREFAGSLAPDDERADGAVGTQQWYDQQGAEPGADMADAAGSLDEGDYVAERVSCFEHGRVEQRAAERNTPERMKVVRIGEWEIEEEMEVVSKRWLGEVLVETIKGGYFAHLLGK